jgi:hypothetical protein
MHDRQSGQAGKVPQANCRVFALICPPSPSSKLG